jgi:hypothetical protein
MKAFPEINQFAAFWPINDLMLLHLKNMSRRSKMRQEKEAAAKAAATCA